MDEKYAEVNGVRLHYVTAGSGPVMVLLHGFPEFWYAWKDLLAEFSRDHQVVAPDLRGYNLSDKPADVAAYAIPQVVGDVRGLIEHISPGRQVVLVGHDWGGVTAWTFAALFPALLERLVIVNAPHPTIFARELLLNPAQQQASSYMARLSGPDGEAFVSANNYGLLTWALTENGARADLYSDEDRAAYQAAWSQPGALTGMINYFRASRAAGANGAPAPALMVRVPTLVIWGDADPVLLPGNLEGLDTLVPDLQIQHIPTGTHWVIHEEPALVSQYIREFLGA